MDYYPDPEEEFEIMFAEELEAMGDVDEGVPVAKRPKQKSLNFGSEAPQRPRSHSMITDDDLLEVDSLMTSQPPPRASAPRVEILPGSLEIPDSPRRAQSPPNPSPSLRDVQEALNASEVRKRKADQLFGDIDDLGSDVEEYLDTAEIGALKRSRQREEPEDTDEILIERIRMERQKFQEEFHANLGANGNGSSGFASWNDCEFLTKRVPRYPFITLRNFESGKYYTRLRSDDYMETEIAKVTAKNCGLLPNSYKAVWEEARALLDQKKQLEELMRKCHALDEGQWVGDGGAAENERLWVEKYKPKGYKDLLSDEGTNKTLLKWLKLWDQCVFNIKRKPQKPVFKPLLKEVNKKWGNSKFSKFSKEPSKFIRKKPASMLSEELDEHGRPVQKIALLSGPPGLGKTTLAHIIARHAGYNPVEVNASDDCSPEAFRLQLEAATQMKSVMSDDPRPNCLILDEIDGSMATAIDVLLQFISDKDSKKGKKKKGGKPQILKRPIICICNDLYVPALRMLRQVSLIISFPPTNSAKLAQRLMHICTLEGLKTDFGALLLLCDKTNNDIRSCLSFLHFFKSRKREVHLLDVQESSVGQKDTHKGLFAVWHEIFQIIKYKNTGSKEEGRADGGMLSISSRIGRVLRTVKSYGDYDRLTQGVFENYLRMKMRDTRFQCVARGMEWFCYFDQLSTVLRESQSYVLMPYMPYCFATWHVLFASFSWPNIRYPSSGYENLLKTQHNQGTLNAVLRGMDPRLRSGTKAAEMLLDCLPLLLHIIMPSLKNVNAQLFSVTEKAELHRVVHIFVEFGLTYVQERTADGDMIYRMEPNVAELVQLPDVPHALSATYAIKQLLAYEVENEKIRRVSGASWGSSCPQATAVSALSPAPLARQAKRATQPEQPAALPNHMQTLSPQIRKPQALRPGLKNWLSISKQPATVAKEKAAADAAESGLQQVAFVYKEGYSNAVRKNIRIADLLN